MVILVYLSAIMNADKYTNDIDLVIDCQYIMHVGLGGVYKHRVWAPDIIRRVFGSHGKSYLGSHVLRQSLVFPVLPKKHVQSEFLKTYLKIHVTGVIILPSLKHQLC